MAPTEPPAFTWGGLPPHAAPSFRVGLQPSHLLNDLTEIPLNSEWGSRKRLQMWGGVGWGGGAGAPLAQIRRDLGGRQAPPDLNATSVNAHLPFQTGSRAHPIHEVSSQRGGQHTTSRMNCWVRLAPGRWSSKQWGETQPT